MKIYVLWKRQSDGRKELINIFYDKNEAEETLEHLRERHDIRRQEYYYLDEYAENHNREMKWLGS